ncbi:MAG: AMP-binding protein, partial [Ktedonobacteraceae bacterium]|nr:AMP-binding protein [Ktedonobacteraceae bacterium]
RKIGPQERNRLDLSSWSVAFNGAEPIFHGTLERFAATFAGCGFRREAFYPCYGLAEATLLVSAGPSKVNEPRHQETSAAQDHQRARVGCGQLLPGEHVLIVDPESSTPCSVGIVGEIWVSGPNVAHGYWNNERETERTFRANLREKREGPFLRTGDLGYIKDGELFVAGRIKDLIVIRGRNHYPQDIELTVQQSDSELESGACAAFSIEREDEERLVILKEISRRIGDPNSLIESIREAIAREHEIQAQAIVLVDKGSIPKTTSGKIQRYECRDRYLAGGLATILEWRENPAPETEPVDSHSADRLLTVDVIAREAIQASLLSFFAGRLGRRATQIDIAKPLLNYGVDSLTAIEVSHHLESTFGVRMSPADLLEDATIGRLARHAVAELKKNSRDTKPAVTPMPREAAQHPLSYGQRSLWFLYQLAPLSGAYNVASAVRIRSALDVGALRCALQKIVDRHDSLRTTFLSREGEPLQRVHQRSEVLLLESDASSWSDELLDEHLVEEAHRPFDLEQGPLLRVSLFTRSPQERILLVVAHHIVVDLWSMGVLIHELYLFYRSENDGKAMA